ncbi:DUF5320 family protein [Candidatus Latescibacterota bacterium]
MPDLNGTGPQGSGPRTGRGRGICGIGIHNLFGKKHNSLSVLSVAVPAVTAVLIDACKPNGFTRKLYSSIKNKLTEASDEKIITSSTVNSKKLNDRNIG